MAAIHGCRYGINAILVLMGPILKIRSVSKASDRRRGYTPCRIRIGAYALWLELYALVDVRSYSGSGSERGSGPYLAASNTWDPGAYFRFPAIAEVPHSQPLVSD